MKRLALPFVLGALLFFPARGDDGQVVNDLFKQAAAARDSGKFDESVQAYEQIIETHPEAYERWYEAQDGITQTLIKKRDFAGAVQSAHLCLDAAPPRAYDEVLKLIANLLSAQDKSVDRANQLIAFAQTGGGNGQANPFDALGYPSLPQRETAFQAMRRQAGDDWSAARLRAATYLLTGHPKEALAQYADAFDRSDDNPNQISEVITDLIGVGLRNVRGSRVGLDQAVLFVAWGSNGPDGKPGTADDLPDPFKPWLQAPSAGQGGLAGFEASGLAELQKVRDELQPYAGDRFLDRSVQSSALEALKRVTTALDGWGVPGQEDWYLSGAYPAADLKMDSYIRETMLKGAELAARGRNFNFGGVHDLWRAIDAKLATDGLQGDKVTEEARADFDKFCAQILQTKFPESQLKPLQTPAVY